MNPKLKTALIWTFTILFTIIFGRLQRMTGPSYPLSGKVDIGGKSYNFELPRSHNGPVGEMLKIEIPDNSVTGKVKFRRFKSNDDWTETNLRRSGSFLVGELPEQPPAGKVMYEIFLKKDTNPNYIFLTKKPVILRFRGSVPLAILLLHIATIFAAFMFAARTVAEVIVNRNNYVKFTMLTIIFTLIGGMILGPVVQKYSFGALWTGWPFGHDLTDNKTLFALIAWLVAYWRLRKNPNARYWVYIAFIIMVAVFIIPHSILGSEIDYTKIPKH